MVLAHDATMNDDDDFALCAKDELFAAESFGDFRTRPVEPGKGAHRDYIHGYKKAADLLVKEIGNDMSIGTGMLAYPILHLYRHFIELSLKEILTIGRQTPPKDHRLNDLWNAVANLAEDEQIDERGSDFMAQLERCVLDYHELDGSGTVFRYADVPSPVCPADLNFTNLFNVMEKLDLQLDCLRECLLQKYENEAEAASMAFGLEANDRV